jgi:hypothetical protein
MRPFRTLPGHDWMSSGVNSLAFSPADRRPVQQPQQMMSGFARQLPSQSVERLPRFRTFPSCGFPGVPGGPEGWRSCASTAAGLRLQFGGAAKKPLYPPAISAVKNALTPLLLLCPFAASDAIKKIHGPHHFILEWAGDHQLKLLAMELLRGLGPHLNGQRRDLWVCLSYLPLVPMYVRC